MSKLAYLPSTSVFRLLKETTLCRMPPKPEAKIWLWKICQTHAQRQECIAQRLEKSRCDIRSRKFVSRKCMCRHPLSVRLAACSKAPNSKAKPQSTDQPATPLQANSIRAIDQCRRQRRSPRRSPLRSLAPGEGRRRCGHTSRWAPRASSSRCRGR